MHWGEKMGPTAWNCDRLTRFLTSAKSPYLFFKIRSHGLWFTEAKSKIIFVDKQYLILKNYSLSHKKVSKKFRGAFLKAWIIRAICDMAKGESNRLLDYNKILTFVFGKTFVFSCLTSVLLSVCSYYSTCMLHCQVFFSLFWNIFLKNFYFFCCK